MLIVRLPKYQQLKVVEVSRNQLFRGLIFLTILYFGCGGNGPVQYHLYF